MHQSQLPEGHPLHTLLTEHETILKYAAEFMAQLENAQKNIDNFDINELRETFHHIKESESHYLREENVLFPTIEKHGIQGPTSVMWAEHEQIREIKKSIRQLFENAGVTDSAELIEKLSKGSRDLSYMLDSHFAKENQILFNMAYQHFTPEEWEATRAEFDAIGYWEVVPEGIEQSGDSKSTISGDMIELPTGKLSPTELNAILNQLPVDITFVDAKDEVRYFSETENPVFVRTVAAIGTNVKNCHPPKSLHLVQQILADFRAKKRSSADFWIHLGPRFVHIRYFPVRDDSGNYLGTMEVTQDITEVHKLEGERRLLSEEN